MAALVENQSINKDCQMKEFTPLLKALTASSSMCLVIDGVENEKIINVLTTLTAMVESVPVLFMSNDKNDTGSKAFRFALNDILLGEGIDEGDDESVKEGEEKEKEIIPSRRNSKRRKDTPTLSLACRRTIAAINFLVSHIRSTSLSVRKVDRQNTRAKGLPADKQISSVFEVLVNLIRDGGYLASCKEVYGRDVFKERSALRKCAGINLLKLCDGSLNLENKYFTSKNWHIFSKIFVDEDFDVRGKKKRCNFGAKLLLLNSCITHP